MKRRIFVLALIFVFLAVAVLAVACNKNNKTNNYYNEEWRLAAQRKGELTVIPFAVEDFSEREGYYKAFEAFFDCDNISCENQLEKLQKAIDKHI